MTVGRAEAQATDEFFTNRTGDAADHRRRLGPWSVSSIGWGTNSGELRNIVDLKVESALPEVITGGINFLDTSPAYRHRRSQAAIGRALPRLLASGAVRREQLVFASHVGFVALDRREEDAQEFFRRQVLPDSGLEDADFVAGAWSMHPRWIRAQLDLACRLLGLEHIDLLYVDAPEIALKQEGPERWKALLMSAFAELESLVSEGRIGAWGIASLEGFTGNDTRRAPLQLPTLLEWARHAGGGSTGLCTIQAPFSLAQLDLLNPADEGQPTLQETLSSTGLCFTGMLSLGQGQLCQDLPQYLHPAMPGCRTDAQRALQFARSTQGVTSALVGMKTREHIQELCQLSALPAMPREDWLALFS